MRAEAPAKPSRTGRYRTPCSACPLRNRQTFRDFSTEELAFVEWFKRGELMVEAGAPIVQEGTSSAHLYTVLEGWAFRYKTLVDGRRQILNFAMPGDLIGLQTSVFETMDHGIEALSPMILCVFPRDQFPALYTRQPSLAFDVTWLSASHERLLDAQLLTVGRRNALERVSYVVWYLFERARDLGMTHGNRLAFPLTQQHLADTLGLSLVHTNKTIKRLRATGCIRWTDRWLEVEDEARLKAIGKVDDSPKRPRPFI